MLRDKFNQKAFYENKTRFMSRISGNKIAEEQMAINSDPDMIVIATQIEQHAGVKFKDPEDENKHFLAYDCWIYYIVRKKQDNKTQQSIPQSQTAPKPQMPQQAPKPMASPNAPQPVQVGPQQQKPQPPINV